MGGKFGEDQGWAWEEKINSGGSWKGRDISPG